MSDIEGRVDDIARRWRSMRPEKIEADELKNNILLAIDEMQFIARVFAHDILISLRLIGGDMRTVRQQEIARCLLELIDEGHVRMLYDDFLADPPAFELVEKKSVK